MLFLRHHNCLLYTPLTVDSLEYNINLSWCSLLSEWDGARCGGLCVGSIPHCDRESRPGWSVFSLSSAAARGVGAVFCTADSIAGEHPSSGFSLCMCDKHEAHTCTFCPRLSSGLSPESKEPSRRLIHLRTITHSSVSHIFFSGAVVILLSFGLLGLSFICLPFN